MQQRNAQLAEFSTKGASDTPTDTNTTVSDKLLHNSHFIRQMNKYVAHCFIPSGKRTSLSVPGAKDRGSLAHRFARFRRSEMQNKQKNNTRDSNVVPHRSTNLARQCLTSLSRREAVLSLWYGRSCMLRKVQNL